jgi:hypothetical protein
MSYQVEENVGCFYYSCSFNIWFVLLLIGFWIFSAIHNSFFEASLVKEIGNRESLKIYRIVVKTAKYLLL